MAKFRPQVSRMVGAKRYFRYPEPFRRDAGVWLSERQTDIIIANAVARPKPITKT